jgi:hypothetical protein
MFFYGLFNLNLGFIIMSDNNYTVKFPFWQFLNQEVFNAQAPVTLNPYRFWYTYRVNLLEKCLMKECDSKGTTN